MQPPHKPSAGYPSPKAGRPTKLTPKVRKRILSALRAGSHLEPACRAAGVGYSTYRHWVNRFPEFREAVERAMAQAEVRLLHIWRKQAGADWRAAKELLARRHPDRWGARDRVDVVAQGPTFQDMGVEFDRADARAALELLRADRIRAHGF